MRETSGKLGIDQEMLRRAVNVGFSGGEKKRNEILQMALLAPRLAVLDETDSGLDIDALKIVADGVNGLRGPDRSFVVITHYQRLLNYIVPDVVHVLSRGRIVRTGGKELALELEAGGYAEYQRGGAGMSAEVAVIKTAAETALAQTFAQARDRLPGDDAIAARRDAAFDVFPRGLAASADRGMEVYRPARADARGKAAGKPARRRGQSACQNCRCECWATSMPAGWFSSMALLSPNCPIYAIWTPD